MARIRKNTADKAAPAGKKPAWKIAAYVRLSRDDGNDESLSISNQKKILMDFLEESFCEEYILVDVYVDDGQTGTDYERPGFQRMIHDVETGRVNCIICKNLSRAFRNYSDQGYFLENVFPRFQTRFITLGDPRIDTFTDPEMVNGMEVPISGLMNDRYAYKTSSDIRRTFDAKRRKGEFIGAFAPYGYMKDPADKNRLIVDPEAAKVVKDIFRWYVYGDGSTEQVKDGDGALRERPKGGMSKEGIARKLNALGIFNPAAYKRSRGLKYNNPQIDQNDGLWQGSAIRMILSNEMYTGTMVQGKQKVISYKVHDRIRVPQEEWYRVADTHEPIIGNELFALAREMQARDVRTAPGKGQSYLFSGLLVCADCHKAMTRRTSKGYVYFNCSTYRRKSKGSCSIHSIRLDLLEKAVLTAVQGQIKHAAQIDAAVREINQADPGGGRAERVKEILHLREREREKTKNMIMNLYLDWRNGEITHEQYQKLKVRLEKQEKQQNAVIEGIRKELSALAEKADSVNPYLEEFLQNKQLGSLSQGIAAELIGEILVHENREITIQFRFAAQPGIPSCFAPQPSKGPVEHKSADQQGPLDQLVHFLMPNTAECFLPCTREMRDGAYKRQSGFHRMKKSIPFPTGLGRGRRLLWKRERRGGLIMKGSRKRRRKCRQIMCSWVHGMKRARRARKTAAILLWGMCVCTFDLQRMGQVWRSC